MVSDIPTTRWTLNRKNYQNKTNIHVPIIVVSNPEPDQLREALLKEISGYFKEVAPDEDLVEKYQYLKNEFQERLEPCIHDRESKYITILHWIVDRIYFLDESNPEHQRTIRASRAIVSIAIACKEDLASIANKEGETALHQAISSNKPWVSALVDEMCGRGDEAARKAIATQNRLGENCLHLAISQKLESVNTLIAIADEEAFCQKRSTDDEKEGDNVSNGGNTPLHDAVNYERCLISRPECSQFAKTHKYCEICRNSMDTFKRKKEYAMDLVQHLIETYGAALKMKNARDESPYLYHIRTKKGLVKKRQESVQSCGDTTIDNSCADIIKEYLIESAFAIGGFSDACGCFFGDQPDEEGQSWPFRPGYPIVSSSLKAYERLIPKGSSILSHVDLQVGKIRTSSTSSNNGDGQSNEKIWNNNMKSIVNVFEMLKDRGVERILKVTVRDNEERPCSDMTIQQCLSPFDVRYLDWNKKDLSINVVYSACPRIAELTLYASGRRAVLESWAASTGLCRLRQLTCVTVNAVKGLEKYENFQAFMTTFETETTENIWLTRWELLFMYDKESIMSDIEKVTKDKGLLLDKINSSKQSDVVATGTNDDLAGLKIQSKDIQNKLDDLKESLEQTGYLLSKVAEKRLLLEKQRRASLRWNHLRVGTSTQDGQASVPVGHVPDARSSGDPSKIESDVQDGQSQYNRFTVRNEDLPKLYIRSSENSGDPDKYLACIFKLELKLEPPPPEKGNGANTTNRSNGYIPDRTPVTMDQSNRWIHSVDEFVRKSISLDDPKDGEIKIALIDDGIDFSQFSSVIQHPGWPPVRPNSQDMLYYYSDSGHGTIMAKMMHRMCPRIKLFIAKLGEIDQITVTDGAERAAKAVKWAIKKDVQIISMSWSLTKSDENSEGIKKLAYQIQQAAAANILLYCAAADKGSYDIGTKLYPHNADTERLRVVGSATENGVQSQFVNPRQVHYLFPGENIPGLDKLKGSSVATALAAGFAALILWCFRCQSPPGAQDSFKGLNADDMHSIFEELCCNSDNNWVNVTTLFGTDGSATHQEVVEWCYSIIQKNNRRSKNKSAQ